MGWRHQPRNALPHPQLGAHVISSSPHHNPGRRVRLVPFYRRENRGSVRGGHASSLQKRNWKSGPLTPELEPQGVLPLLHQRHLGEGGGRRAVPRLGLPPRVPLQSVQACRVGPGGHLPELQGSDDPQHRPVWLTDECSLLLLGDKSCLSLGLGSPSMP